MSITNRWIKRAENEPKDIEFIFNPPGKYPIPQVRVAGSNDYASPLLPHRIYAPPLSYVSSPLPLHCLLNPAGGILDSCLTPLYARSRQARCRCLPPSLFITSTATLLLSLVREEPARSVLPPPFSTRRLPPSSFVATTATSPPPFSTCRLPPSSFVTVTATSPPPSPARHLRRMQERDGGVSSPPPSTAHSTEPEAFSTGTCPLICTIETPPQPTATSLASGRWFFHRRAARMAEPVVCTAAALLSPPLMLPFNLM
ncbi:hypothetical protein CPB84DRAFT_1852841 [Gymnopilus junonius]|uniref:Uncharacterized protein n=1 Tax=Gymnopilus junonius TaxID=109634 RepID=A0A9P5NDB2_GYMJU|nr:hypothetical protein CPB84DRAFT_1852841 [Gymnopilus junonius]